MVEQFDCRTQKSPGLEYFQIFGVQNMDFFLYIKVQKKSIYREMCKLICQNPYLPLAKYIMLTSF